MYSRREIKLSASYGRHNNRMPAFAKYLGLSPGGNQAVIMAFNYCESAVQNAALCFFLNVI